MVLDEKSFLMVVALIATNVMAYTFSQISEIVRFEDSKKQSFNKMMIGINYQMKVNSLSMNLQQKVRSFFKFIHYQNREQLNISDKFINQLPKHLKEEVLLDLNKEISQIKLFQDFSQQSLREISLSIKQRSLIPDETIVKQNELTECLFYITSGNLEIISTTQQKQSDIVFSNTHNILKRKDSFGYEGLLLGEVSPYSIKSVGSSTVSYIDKVTLLNILKDYPLDCEKFFYLKDQSLYGQIHLSFKLNCISCGQKDHYLLNCPYVSVSKKYKPNKQLNDRNDQFERKKDRYDYHLKDLKTLQEQAMAVIANNDQSLILDAMSVFKKSKMATIIDEGEENEDDSSLNSDSDSDLSSKSSSNSDSKTIQPSIDLHSNEHNKINIDNIIQKDEGNINNSNHQQNNLSKNKIPCLTYHDLDSSERITLFPNKITLDDAESRVNLEQLRQLHNNNNNISNNEEEIQVSSENRIQIKNVPLGIKQSKEDNTKKKVIICFNPSKTTHQFDEIQQKGGSIIFKSERDIFQDKNSQKSEINVKQQTSIQNFEQSNKSHQSLKNLESKEMLLLKQTFEKRQKRSKQQFNEQNKSISNRILKQTLFGNQNIDQYDNAEEENDPKRLPLFFPTKAQQGSISYDKKNPRKSFIQIVQQFSKLNNQDLGLNKAKTIHKMSDYYNHNSKTHDVKENQIEYTINNIQSMSNNQITKSPSVMHKHSQLNNLFETTEEKIRCEYNLQNLDLLVVRKEFLLLQQQNIIQNYIEVLDNEIDIDLLKTYNYYYRNHNIKNILNLIQVKKNVNRSQSVGKGQYKMRNSISKKRNVKKTQEFKNNPSIYMRQAKESNSLDA